MKQKDWEEINLAEQATVFHPHSTASRQLLVSDDLSQLRGVPKGWRPERPCRLAETWDKAIYDHYTQRTWEEPEILITLKPLFRLLPYCLNGRASAFSDKENYCLILTTSGVNRDWLRSSENTGLQLTLSSTYNFQELREKKTHAESSAYLIVPPGYGEENSSRMPGSTTNA
jgi:hypothetical protein